MYNSNYNGQRRNYYTAVAIKVLIRREQIMNDIISCQARQKTIWPEWTGLRD